ncbi:aminoglycoside phosphotransferase family protein [Actinoplanes sp. Pm04-4]|uniref:Aminoglycoside phosphotransferase family protein n=1 Tax=Paractinoplanes pyxinae TaxID=2997416 RepID=A0ABT4AVS4_9ACTN|nr:aminoglycoside phosphotransferase family protein [Actinoplanes pyxinae]MCY1137535.1 aminoglycoside phosphotransferase family protein [Actinoplanes pyxinae]
MRVVRERPEGLTDDDVVRGLADGWRLAVSELEFLPVGAGGYHWSATAGAERWFVTIDVRADLPTLRRALGTAAALRRAGLDFVLAPIPDRDGDAARPLSHQHALSVYPLVPGTAGDFGPHPAADRSAVLDLLIALHQTEPPPIAQPTDLRLPGRADLEAALNDLEGPWTSGPYAEPARQVLSRHAARITAWLQDFDNMAADVAPATDWVVTHGEPHPGNVLKTPTGLRLIDWDTTRLAPPERDLWMLTPAMIGAPPHPDDGLLAHYEHRTGRTVSRRTIAFYRLWWILADLAVYTTELRRPHTPGPDLANSLHYLTANLE